MESNIKLDDNVQAYIVLGYGEGLIKSFTRWLNKKKHYLVVLDTKQSLKNQKIENLPNVSVETIDSEVDVTIKLKELAWRFIFLNIELVISDSFQEEKLSALVSKEWQKIKTGVHLSASAFADFQLPDLASAMKNIHEEIECSYLADLKGCLNKVPAIICGAGPSLDQSFFEFKEKALVFSGGSALNALKLSPHFIGLTDSRTPPGFFKKSFEESRLFFSLKAPHEIVNKNFKQKFLCFAEERYLFFRLIVEKLGAKFDPIDMGWSTVTFLTAIAVYLGCDPIIFNGVDLCFKAKQIYAEDVAKISYRKKNSQEFISVKDEKGNSKKTQNDWLMSAFFLQKLTEANPSINFYNLSEEGLFLGDRVKPLKIEKLSSWDNINIEDKLKCFESKPTLALSKDLNAQILDMISTEEKTVEKSLKELEEMFNGKIKELSPKEISWCEKNVLNVLWDIFKQVILRDEKRDENFSFKEKVHQVLFYKDVLAQHKSQLKRYSDV